jgi:hypothetical protein
LINLNTAASQATVQADSGTHRISAPVTMWKDTTFNVASGAQVNLDFAPTATGVNVTKTGAGTVTLPSVRANSLTVSAGSMKFNTDGTNAGVSRVTVLNVTSGATLDLANNSVVVDYAGTSPVNSIRSALLSGRGAAGVGNATWRGTGITSSTAAGDPQGLAIGYAENSALPMGAFSTFGGQSVDSSSVLVKYTRAADADLDGVVNDNDVTIVGAFYLQPNTGEWYFGDFDYSGRVDDGDVTLLGAFYSPTAKPLSAADLTSQYGAEFAAAFEAGQAMGANVPEPTSIVLTAIAAGMLLRRRRR